ncbi:hypothetical protein GPJ56_008857 [Histomonas meleagridis]|uniref:uncharacterized protein n=1 Tax=Histomonas meleagridis TaxID=135588 RepID=UPI003559E1AB|nr:hypothetical protein GPJ56_008857 [Histomonas meleagridis]KAH0805350.1 hypothetical protein GO595_001732 [Histomonas meleagridis]
MKSFDFVPLSKIISIQQKLSVYVAALVTTEDWTRSVLLYETWGREFIERYGGVLKFSSATPYKPFENITLVNPKYVNGGFRKLFYLFNDSVKDFLENTTLQWIYRATEDCYVNLDLFGEFYEKMISQYSPSTYVFKGQVCPYIGGTFYIHGGSGWFISRAAAQKYYDLLDTMTPYYVSHYVGDDVVIYNFTKRMNLTAKDIEQKEFLGHSFSNDDFERIRTLNFTGIKKCPHATHKLKETVFWHSGRSDNFQMVHGKEIYPKLPDNLYHDFGLCTKDE